MLRIPHRPVIIRQRAASLVLRPTAGRYSTRAQEHEEQIQTLKKQLAALRLESFRKRTEYQCAAFAREQCDNWDILRLPDRVCAIAYNCPCKILINGAFESVKEADAIVQHYEELLDKHQKNKNNK